jgi:hypothetical protein
MDNAQYIASTHLYYATPFLHIQLEIYVVAVQQRIEVILLKLYYQKQICKLIVMVNLLLNSLRD